DAVSEPGQSHRRGSAAGGGVHQREAAAVVSLQESRLRGLEDPGRRGLLPHRRSAPVAHHPRRRRAMAPAVREGRSFPAGTVYCAEALMRRALVGLIVVAALAATAHAQFQRRGGGRFFSPRIGPNPEYDGAFQFCRIMFRNAPDGDGGGWSVDWPRADQNLSYRFSELTRTSVSKSDDGNFNHVLIRLTDEERLARCPFIMITEPGGAYFDDAEAKGLRTYLQRGGF